MNTIKKFLLRTKTSKLDQTDEAYQSLLEHPSTFSCQHQTITKAQNSEIELDYKEMRRNFFMYCVIRIHIWRLCHTKLLQSCQSSPLCDKLSFVLLEVYKILISAGRLNSNDLKIIIGKYFGETKVENFERDNPDCYAEILNAISGFIDDAIQVHSLLIDPRMKNKKFTKMLDEKIMMTVVRNGKSEKVLRPKRELVELFKSLANEKPK